MSALDYTTVDEAADAVLDAIDEMAERWNSEQTDEWNRRHRDVWTAAIVDTGWSVEQAARFGNLSMLLPESERERADAVRGSGKVRDPWGILTGDDVTNAVADAVKDLRRVLVANAPGVAGAAAYAPLDLSTLSGAIPAVGYAPGDLARRFIYGEGLTTFAGKAEAGKSKLGQRLAIDAMRAGRSVAHFDWEQGQDEVIGTYLKLGAPLELIQARLLYLPEPDAIVRVRLDTVADDNPGVFVLVDSMSRAADAAGLSGTDWAGHAKIASDLNAFGVARGCPVLLLDHLGRDAAKTTRYATGATGKLNAARGQWNIATVSAFSEHKAGEIVATNVKARSGGLDPYRRFGVGGDGVDRIDFRTLDAGEVPAVKIEHDVLEFLRDAGVAQSMNAIEKGVEGKGPTIREVVKRMAGEPDGPVRGEKVGAYVKYAA